MLHHQPHLHVCCDEPGCLEILESESGNIGPFRAILRLRGWELRAIGPIDDPPETIAWRWLCPMHAGENSE